MTTHTITVQIVPSRDVNHGTLRHLTESIVRTFHHVDEITVERDVSAGLEITLTFRVLARDMHEALRTGRAVEGALRPLVDYVLVSI